jgi:repressor LexA
MADVRDAELAKLIGFNITNRLIAKNKTQQDLADYLGASKSTVSMWVNGKRTPLMATIDQICKYFDCTREDLLRDNRESYYKHSISIPVYARVAAGIPLEAVEDIIDREEIPEPWEQAGTYFGVRVKGDSMAPRIENGDVVIVRKQEDADDGDIVIALVNGNDAVCKRLRKYAGSRGRTRSRGPKSQGTEPTVRFRVNLRVQRRSNANPTQILRWRVVGEYYANS